MNAGLTVKTVINPMVFDGSTTDPVQRAVRNAIVAFMAATAQAHSEQHRPPRRLTCDPPPDLNRTRRRHTDNLELLISANRGLDPLRTDRYAPYGILNVTRNIGGGPERFNCGEMIA